MKTRQKPKIRASVHVNRLYKAVDNYVRANGGNLVVIGGIQVQRWPNESPANFSIAVKCTGKPPTFENLV